MNRFFKPILCYLFISFFFSCDYTNILPPNSVIKGKVVETCTNKPLGGVTVDFIYGGTLLTDRTVTTEADGLFEIHYNNSSGPFNYWLNFHKDNYKDLQHQGIYPFMQEGYVIDLKPSTSQADLLLKIKNTTPFFASDNISVQITEPAIPQYYSSCSPILNQSFPGATVDTLLNLPICACNSVLVKINWQVRKNNITTSFVDSLTVNNGTTAQYQINY